jgi:hypothetical protein
MDGVFGRSSVGATAIPSCGAPAVDGAPSARTSAWSAVVTVSPGAAPRMVTLLGRMTSKSSLAIS